MQKIICILFDGWLLELHRKFDGEAFRKVFYRCKGLLLVIHKETWVEIARIFKL